MITMLKSTVSSLIVAVVLVSAPLTASAQTNFQPQTLQEMIAYLQGIIATLEAQLRAQQGGATVGGGGSTIGRSVAETLAPQSIVRDGAYLRGQVNLTNSDSVTLWFEYGRSIVNENETPRQRLNNVRQYNYNYSLFGLRTNTTYRYRMVVETANGQRYYGSVREFTTGDYSQTNTSASGGSLRLDRNSYAPWSDIVVTVPNSSDLNSAAWIGVFERGASNRSYLSWSYVANRREVSVSAPGSSGTYELRLFRDGQYDQLLTSTTFTVQ